MPDRTLRHLTTTLLARQAVQGPSPRILGRSDPRHRARWQPYGIAGAGGGVSPLPPLRIIARKPSHWTRTPNRRESAESALREQQQARRTDGRLSPLLFGHTPSGAGLRRCPLPRGSPRSLPLWQSLSSEVPHTFYAPMTGRPAEAGPGVDPRRPRVTASGRTVTFTPGIWRAIPSAQLQPTLRDQCPRQFTAPRRGRPPREEGRPAPRFGSDPASNAPRTTEHLWTRAGAGRSRRRLINTLTQQRNVLQTPASRCHQLRQRTHGKEGVDGSSPSEGSTKPG